MKKEKPDINKPELVCPAGDWRSLITAVDSGADSIYFGIKGLNMRAKADNFDISQLPKIMDYLHRHGKKGYLALNVVVMNQELDKTRRFLEEAKANRVDAVILWDMAVLSMAREMGLTVHLSTQASVSNSMALAMYANLGVKRVVLARECTIKDIRRIIGEINDQGIACQIEAFVHGAMCVSVSGRCFLSSYTFGNSANKGQCRQPCRREFVIKDTNKKSRSEFILGNDYVLSPKDLCTIDFIDLLIQSGIHSFKIEGRMRSEEYIKIVVSSYRRAIDAYFDGQWNDQLKEELKIRLASVYNREFSTGFYFGKPVDWNTANYQKSHEKIFLGEVTNYYQRIGVAELLIRNEQLNRGDTLLFLGNSTPATFAVAHEMQREHQEVTQALRGEPVAVKIPFKVRRNDQVYLWREKKD